MKKQKKQPQLESQNLILYPLLPEQMNLLRDDPNELCRSLSFVPDDYAKYGEWVLLAEEQYRKMMADQEYMSFYTLWIITERGQAPGGIFVLFGTPQRYRSGGVEWLY